MDIENLSNSTSPKSFGIAVTLVGIFGVVGIHHFYLKNWLHGIFDLSLFLFAIYFLLQDEPAAILTGVVLIFLDFVHTVLVMFYLITGKQKDGAGQLIVYPGQLA